jgi:hypothetical protein
MAITCDHCGADLGQNDNVPRYYLHVRCCRRPTGLGPILDIFVIPPIADDLHFCGLYCLCQWATARHQS